MSVSLSHVDGPGDAELIAAVRGGDLDAYGELYARHVDAARRLARQLTTPSDADDLVSDAFTKVLTVLQRGGGPDLAFRAYLLTAVRRLHVDRLRSGSRLRPVDDLTPFDPGLPFHDTAVEGFETAAAAKAFASLPERWQMVLWHTEVEGQKPADIAPLLGMSANSVAALAYRAREGLRQAFLSQHAADMDDVDCAWTRDHLGAYVRGGLSRRDAAKVDEHLADCRACAAVYLELSEVNSGLAVLLAPLLLGAAGAGYLATSPGALGAAGGVTGGFAAAKAWTAAHASLTVVGGMAVTATALFAVYGATHLNGHGAADVGSPTLSGVPTAGAGSGDANGPGGATGGRNGGSANPSAGGSTVPSSTGTDSASPHVGPTGGPNSLPGTQPGSPPGTEPGSPAGSTPPGGDTGPGGNPTDNPSQPSGGPSNPTSGPTGTGSPVRFTSTPPAHPGLGDTYVVRATSSSGSVAFAIDPATTHDACSLSGHTVSFDHAGTCVVAAHQTSKTVTRAADPPTQRIVVPRGSQVIRFTSGPPHDAVVGGPSYAVDAAGGRSGRPVSFSVDPATTRDACAVRGSTVRFRHHGTCVIAAHQAGSSDYRPTHRTQRVDVGKGLQTFDFTLSSDQPVVGGTATLDVTRHGASGEPVDFRSTTPEVCRVQGSTVLLDHATGDGSRCRIEGTQNGDDDYRPASATHDLEIGRGHQSLSFGLPDHPTVGQSVDLVGTSSSGGPVTFATTSRACDVTGSVDAGYRLSFLHADGCTVTASQDGTADYDPTQVDQTTQVGKADQAVDFTVTSAHQVVRDTGTLSVTAQGDSGQPVTFSSATPDACTVSGTTVTFRHATTCTVEADQAATDDYNAAPPVTHDLQVGKADQAVDFTVTSAHQVVRGTGTLSVTAQGDSGQPVTFSSATPDACTVSGTTVTFRHATTCTVEADQAATDDYNAAPPVTHDLQVGKADQTIDFTSTPPTSPSFGDTYLPAATADSGDPVRFSVDPATTHGACTIDVTQTVVTVRHNGSCVIDADQRGNDDYLPAPTAQQTFAVGKADQTVTFAVPDHPTVGQSVDLVGTSTSGGPVTFTSTSRACTVTGSTGAGYRLAFVHAGTCTVTGSQAGTDDYRPASADRSTQVGRADQTVDFTFTSGKPVVHGTGTLTVTMRGGSGQPVTFGSLTPDVCTVSGTAVTFRHAGTCTVGGDQAGTDDYAAAPSVSRSLKVAQADQTVTFTSTPPSPAYVGSTYQVKATGGDSGQPVTFGSGTTAVCTVSGSTVTFVTTGTCTVQADQAGTDDYKAAARATQSLTVSAKVDLYLTAQPSSRPPIADHRWHRVDVTVHDLAAGSTATVTGDSSANGVLVVPQLNCWFMEGGTCHVMSPPTTSTVQFYVLLPTSTASAQVTFTVHSATSPDPDPGNDSATVTIRRFED